MIKLNPEATEQTEIGHGEIHWALRAPRVELLWIHAGSGMTRILPSPSA